MRWYTKVLAAGIAALLQACVTAPLRGPAPLDAGEPRAPVTLLVSIDGFRADYLDRGATPVLSGLAAEGVRGALRPAFPAKTFPNHTAIVTGLRPDRNGIVGNRFEDPAHPGDVFTLPRTEPFWWSQSEPLWISAERAGIRTATMFWPGSNVAHDGRRPSDWQHFNADVTGEQRVDAVLDWLRRPDPAKRPRFVTLYFDTVDTAGHSFGPDAPETNAAIAAVDALIGRLKAELDAMHQPANLVVVADHGMDDVSSDRLVRLYRVLDPADFRVLESGPFATIVPSPGRDAAVAAILLAPQPHMQCWRRGDVPERLHWGRNPRAAPFLCLAEPGWIIAAEPPKEEPFHGGAHGWDPDLPSMRAVFVASGPAFAAGARIGVVDTVDVYPLLRKLVGLPDASGIDGRLDALTAALAQ